MRSPRLVALLCLGAVALALASGFWLGVREGEYVAAVASAPLRGGFAGTALTSP
jgi:hypothetical protein